jgi:hypothetical protein
MDARCECLTELSRDEVLWRFHFMLGTIHYTDTSPNCGNILSQRILNR